MIKQSDCKVCKLVRFYLLLAVPLIAMVGLSINGSSSNAAEPLWFANVALIDYLAYGAATALVVVVSYRVYFEYLLPKRRQRSLDKLIDNLPDDTDTD